MSMMLAIAWTEIAGGHVRDGDLAAAEDAYLLATAQDATYIPARVGIARLHAWQGQRRLAEAELSSMDHVDDPALLALIRVQTARVKPRAAKASMARAEARGLTIDRERRIREHTIQLDGSATGGTLRGSVSGRVQLTGALALHGGLRAGRPVDQPLLSGGNGGQVGMTWSDQGWWVTPSVRWDDGLWVGGDVARRAGPCAADVGAWLGSGVRAQVGGSCELGPVRTEARLFTDGPTAALTGAVGTRGTWRGTARGVWLTDDLGGLGAVRIEREGADLGIYVEGGWGTGVVDGLHLGAGVRLTR